MIVFATKGTVKQHRMLAFRMLVHVLGVRSPAGRQASFVGCPWVLLSVSDTLVASRTYLNGSVHCKRNMTSHRSDYSM